MNKAGHFEEIYPQNTVSKIYLRSGKSELLNVFMRRVTKQDRN
jgi:hypothetical protein